MLSRLDVYTILIRIYAFRLRNLHISTGILARKGSYKIYHHIYVNVSIFYDFIDYFKRFFFLKICSQIEVYDAVSTYYPMGKILNEYI